MEEMSQEKIKLGRSLASSELFIKLCESDYLSSTHFKNLEFDSFILKPFVEEYGVGNASVYQMILYALLIIPKEILPAKYYYKMDKEYYYLNMTINRIAVEKHSTFAFDKTLPKYVFHMINSIIQGRCNHIIEEDQEYMIFEDYNKKNYFFYKIKLKDLLKVIKLLQQIMMIIYNKLV